jgi:allophanate hydrolase subunit 1
MRLFPLGDCGLLAELETLPGVLALLAALEAAASGRPPGIEDLVPAERTLLVRFDPRLTDGAAVLAWIRGVTPVRRAPGGSAGARIEIPVRYDGEDLAEVGRLTGLGPGGVVTAHTGRDWTVAFTGFAPGFAYLVDGDPRLHVARLPTPRTRVPSGAVALAGRYSGVYPRASPGGWRIIGTTPADVWDPQRDPPALLRPGRRVCFVDVS